MPKRNYGFEKRQKELARKQKQEDKRQRNLERARDKAGDPAPDVETPGSEPTE